jgi:MFS family permease
MLAGLAQSMDELIGFRALQGIGAGGLMVGAQAIIADIVPPRERGRYMGLIGSVFAVASVAGPLLGGFLVDNLSWRWVFYVNMPVGALAVLIVRRGCTCTRRRRAQIDYLGARLLSAARRRRSILAHDLGRQPVRVGLADDRRPRPSPACSCSLFVWWETARRADPPAAALPLARVRRRQRDGLHDRDGDVRRDRVHPALPAARLRRAARRAPAYACCR